MDILRGEYFLKGRDLLEPSDPHAQLVEDHRKLKKDFETLQIQKTEISRLLSQANTKVYNLEAMDEGELVAKVCGWLGSIVVLSNVG